MAQLAKEKLVKYIIAIIVFIVVAVIIFGQNLVGMITEFSDSKLDSIGIKVDEKDYSDAAVHARVIEGILADYRDFFGRLNGLQVENACKINFNWHRDYLLSQGIGLWFYSEDSKLFAELRKEEDVILKYHFIKYENILIRTKEGDLRTASGEVYFFSNEMGNGDEVFIPPSRNTPFISYPIPTVEYQNCR